MTTFLVTGGAGFVGSHLAIRLKQHREQARVIALDNLLRRGSELALPRLRTAGVEFVYGDVRQSSDLETSRPIDYVRRSTSVAGSGRIPRCASSLSSALA